MEIINDTISLENILHHIEMTYNIRINHAEPVYGGWLNQKWKLSTFDGELLMKQYSPKRYNKERLEVIEVSLKYQDYLYQNYFKCPKLYQNKGRFIKMLESITIMLLWILLREDN